MTTVTLTLAYLTIALALSYGVGQSPKLWGRGARTGDSFNTPYKYLSTPYISVVLRTQSFHFV